eukprot:Opistho-2@14997
MVNAPFGWQAVQTVAIVALALALALALAPAPLAAASLSTQSTCDGADMRDERANETSDSAFSYSSEAVPEEYVVNFRAYYARDTAARIIARALRSRLAAGRFEAVRRHNAAEGMPSDFAVVKLFNVSGAETEVALAGMREYPLIKHVSAHKRISRSLLSFGSGGARALLARSARRLSFDAEAEADDDDAIRSNDKDGSETQGGRRLLGKTIQRPVSALLQADLLWTRGFTGKDIRVAIFDTRLREDHPHFRNVLDRTDWTDEATLDDNLGHGTFVAGVIASSRECLGLAPDADLFIFRVFTVNQVSYTSWFLDAFNYAIHKRVHVLNLSIGGPDFLDQPFVEKVWELTANGIIMVSAIGNDGPLYGTLNNPADQMDVIGVGGTDYDDNIAAFSSRGMTGWELPRGYGRVKPDIVTYGYQVGGSHKKSGCRTLSGTSVASPVVAGAVALLCSVIPAPLRPALSNPASIKQAIIESATRLDGPNMFEQSAGKLDLVKAYQVLSAYEARASAVPATLDLTSCPYAWPYCTQPLYYGAMPVTVNVTVLNGMGVSGWFSRAPTFTVSGENGAGVLDVRFMWSDVLWPWAGYLSVGIVVNERGLAFSGVISGSIDFEIRSAGKGRSWLTSRVSIPLTVRVIPTPGRHRRVLWDQFHNLRYPSGYFPRDNLRMKMDPLDWNGDHIHTNFKELYQALRERDYFVEVLGEPLTCFDARQYGTLIIADAEEEFHPLEIEKMRADVEDRGLSVLVLGEWYNADIMRDKIRFFDENTRQWWSPETGGANVPALNDLLDHFGIAMGDAVYEGQIAAGDDDVELMSSSSIVRFPTRGLVLVGELTNLGDEMVKGLSHKDRDVAVLGLYQTPEEEGGRIVVYTDSSCADSAHAKGNCFPFMGKLVEYAATGVLDSALARSCERLSERYDKGVDLPRRLATNLRQFSKVLDPNGVGFRALAACGANGTANSERRLAEDDSEAVDDLLQARRGWVQPALSGPREGEAGPNRRRDTGQSSAPWILFLAAIALLVAYSVYGRGRRRRVISIMPSV